MWHWTQITDLTEGFGDLGNIEWLDLRNCNHLEFLPESFGRLVRLQTLDISHCDSLKALPESE